MHSVEKFAEHILRVAVHFHVFGVVLLQNVAPQTCGQLTAEIPAENKKAGVGLLELKTDGEVVDLDNTIGATV